MDMDYDIEHYVFSAHLKVKIDNIDEIWDNLPHELKINPRLAAFIVGEQHESEVGTNTTTVGECEICGNVPSGAAQT